MNFIDRIKNAASSIANATGLTVFLTVLLCGLAVVIGSFVLEVYYSVFISSFNGGATLIAYKAALHAYQVSEFREPVAYVWGELTGNDPSVTAPARGVGFVLIVISPLAGIIKALAPVVRSAITRAATARAA